MENNISKILAVIDNLKALDLPSILEQIKPHVSESQYNEVKEKVDSIDWTKANNIADIINKK